MRVAFLGLAIVLAVCAADAPRSETVEGKLTMRDGQPALDAGGKLIALDGDQATRGVLNDKRLRGVEMKAKGRFTAPDKFTIDPIHTRALLVHHEGHLKLVTYWCDICSIRTYSPGPCWCCQKETTLDLRDPDAK
jgi:hypothetical protein